MALGFCWCRGGRIEYSGGGFEYLMMVRGRCQEAKRTLATAEVATSSSPLRVLVGLPLVVARWDIKWNVRELGVLG